MADAPETFNVGVEPMPSEEEQRAAIAKEKGVPHPALGGQVYVSAGGVPYTPQDAPAGDPSLPQAQPDTHGPQDTPYPATDPSAAVIPDPHTQAIPRQGLTLEDAVDQLARENDAQTNIKTNLAAFRVAHSDLPIAKARNIGMIAAYTGQDPNAVFNNYDEMSKQYNGEWLAEKLRATPNLARLAFDAINAPYIKDDVANLSFLEWTVTGRIDNIPGGGEAEPIGDPTTGLEIGQGVHSLQQTVPNAPVALTIAALKEQKLAWLQAKYAHNEISGPEYSEMVDLENHLQNRDYIGEEGPGFTGWLRHQGAELTKGTINFAVYGGLLSLVEGAGTLAGAGATTGLVPEAAPAAAATGGAVGAYAASAAFNYMQQVGPLFRQLQMLQRDDGTPILSESEARHIAIGTSVVTAGLTGYLGTLLVEGGFINRLLGKGANEAMKETFAKATTGWAIKRALKDFTKHELVGGALMGAQAAANQGAKVYALRGAGEDIGYGTVGSAFVTGSITGMRDMLLFGATAHGRKALYDLGISAMAEHYGKQIDADIAAAKASTFIRDSNVQAQEFIRDLKPEAQPGEPRGYYLPLDVWDKYFSTLEKKVDPRDAMKYVMQDDGSAYDAAKASTGKGEGYIFIPEEKFLARLAQTEHGVKLANDTTKDLEVPTRNQELELQKERKKDIDASISENKEAYQRIYDREYAIAKSADAPDEVADTHAIFRGRFAVGLAVRDPRKHSIAEWDRAVGQLGMLNYEGKGTKVDLDKGDVAVLNQNVMDRRLGDIAAGTTFGPETNSKDTLIGSVQDEIRRAEAGITAGGDSWKSAFYQEYAAGHRSLLKYLQGLKPSEVDRIIGNEIQGQDKAVFKLQQLAGHGTPRTEPFDKFLLRYISTGEGGQAFGRGLYFAQNPAVYTGYRNNLAESRVLVNGKRHTQLPLYSLESRAGIELHSEVLQRQYEQRPIDSASVLASVKESLKERIEFQTDLLLRQAVIEKEAPHLIRPDDRAFYEEIKERTNKERMTLKYLEGLKDSAITIGPQEGRVYMVDLPEMDKLLQWDKDFRDQPPAVVDKLKKAGLWKKLLAQLGVPEGMENLARPTEFKGEDLYYAAGNLAQEIRGRELNNQEKGDAASAMFREAGVPGHAFLDRLSRTGEAEAPTHNFVMWDEGSIQILNHYQQLAMNMQRERGHIEFHLATEKTKAEPLKANLYTMLGADASTRAHEQSHFFFEAMSRMVESELNHPGLERDFQTLLEFAGYKTNKQRRSEQLERTRLLQKDALSGAPSDFNKAIDAVAKDKNPSVTKLQRDLNIGFARAGELMSQLEKAGVVSAPGEGNRRSLLASPEEAAKAKQQIGGLTPVEQSQLKRLTAKEEKVSAAWETYLATGEVPSKELAPVFRRFKDWMLSIYKSVANIGKKYQKEFGKELVIPDHVKEVFDRWVAADVEIDKADPQPPPSKAEPMPEAFVAMATPAEKEEHAKLEDSKRERAKEELFKSMSEAEKLRAKNEEIKAAQEAATKQATEEVRQRPEFQALDNLNASNIKFTRAQIADQFGAPVLELLPHEIFSTAPFGRGATTPDQAAPQLGFASGWELMHALAGAHDREGIIENRVKELLAQQQVPPPMAENKPEMQEAAGAAAGNRDAIRQAEIERAAYNRGAQDKKAPMSYEAMQRAARKALLNRPIEEIQYQFFHVLERQAAARAYDAAMAGDFASARQFKDAQLFNFHQGKVAREIREEVTAQRKTIEEHDSPTARARLAKARAPGEPPMFLDMHDSLLEATSLREADGNHTVLKSLLPFQQYYEGLGQEFLTPEGRQLMDSLLQTARPWKKLTPIEAAFVHDAIVNIDTNARVHSKSLLDNKYVDTNEVFKKVQEEAAILPTMIGGKFQKVKNAPIIKLAPPPPEPPAEGGGPPKEPPAPPAPPGGGGEGRPPQEAKGPVPADPSALSRYAKWFSSLGAIDGALLQPEDMLRMVSPTLARYIFHDGYLKAVYAERRMARDIASKFESKFRRLPDELEAIRHDKLKLDDLPIPPDAGMAGDRTRQWLWSLALTMGHQEGRELIKRTMGWSDRDVANAAVKHFGPGEWKFLQDIVDISGGVLKPAVDEKNFNKTGVRPEPIEKSPWKYLNNDGSERVLLDGWFPHRFDRREGVGRPGEAGEVYDPEYVRAVTTGESGYTRVPSFTWETVPSFVAQVIHDLAFDQFGNEQAMFLNRLEVKQFLTSKMGEAKAGMVKDWVEVAMNRNVRSVSVANRKAFEPLQWARGVTIYAAIGYSIPVAMSNFADLGVAWMSGAAGSMLYAVPNFLDTALHYRKMADTYTPLSDMLQVRAQNWKREMRDRLGELGVDGQKGFVGRGLERIKMGAFGLVEAMDKFTSLLIWSARYRDEMRQHGNNYTPEQQAEAVRLADEGLRRGGGIVNDPAMQSALLRDKGMVGSLLVFGGYFNRLYNIQRGLIHETRLKWLEADNPTEYMGAARHTAITAGRYVGIMAFSSLFGELLAGRGKDPNEDWDTWMARKMLAAPAQTLPFVGPLVEQMADRIVTGRTRQLSNIRPAPSLAVLQDLYNTYGKLMEEGRSGQDKAYDAAEQIAALMQLPARQMRRTLGFWGNVATGRARAYNTGDYVSGTLYGERDRQPSNMITMWSNR